MGTGETVKYYKHISKLRISSFTRDQKKVKYLKLSMIMKRAPTFAAVNLKTLHVIKCT